ncbi:MAG: AmmeMemoRadiSam system protein B [Longimicrobiales bacterium]
MTSSGVVRRPRSRDRPLLLALPLLISGLVLPGAAAVAQPVGVRPPAVAGSFYPDEPEALRKQIEDLLAAASADGIDPALPVRAGIVPHAGLDYSGQVAARFYRAVQGREYDAVVLVAVSHQEAFAGVSIWPGSHLSTPLGEIPIERALAESLVDADDSIHFATEGYGAEHSLEVQLPFLQTVLPDVPVVPLMVGRQSLDLSYHLARTLAAVLAGRNVLLLASSDLSHFHDEATAARLDGELLDLVRSNDPFFLGYRSFTGELEACGVGGVVAVLEAARRLGAGRTQVLAYDNSGRVTGDMSNVVGYTAVTVSDGPGGSDALTPHEKELLVEIARASVAAAVRRKAPPPMPALTPALKRTQAAFVTLRSGGELRGCVGAVFATQPLAQQVRESALAASRDTRFVPLSAEELPRLDYDISLLSPLTPLDDPGSLVIGRDGLMLVRGDWRGVLLPVVAVEQGWDRDTFLEQVGVKAGLGRDAWRQPGTLLFSFSAESVR